MARLDMKKVGVVGVAGLIDIGLGEWDASRRTTTPTAEPWKPWAEIGLAVLGYLGYTMDVMEDIAEPLAYAMTVPAMNALYAEIKKRTAPVAEASPSFAPAGFYHAPAAPSNIRRSYFPNEAKTAPVNL